MASTNCRTLSAAEPVLRGLSLIAATVTGRGFGAEICSSEMSSHQIVAYGAF